MDTHKISKSPYFIEICIEGDFDLHCRPNSPLVTRLERCLKAAKGKWANSQHESQHRVPSTGI